MYTRKDKPVAPTLFANATVPSTFTAKARTIIDMLQTRAMLTYKDKDIENDSHDADQHARYLRVHEITLKRDETGLEQNEFKAIAELLNDLLDEYENVGDYRLKITVSTGDNALTIHAKHCYPLWENEIGPYPAPIREIPFYAMKTRLQQLYPTLVIENTAAVKLNRWS